MPNRAINLYDMITIVQAIYAIANQLGVNFELITGVNMKDESGNNWNYCFANRVWKSIHLENHRFAVWHISDTDSIYLSLEKDIVKNANYPNLKFFYGWDEAHQYFDTLSSQFEESKRRLDFQKRLDDLKKRLQ